MKHPYTEALHNAGWTAETLAKRWGIKRRQMQNICRHPKSIHWDALKGVERG